jgi:hypothetical protein
MLRCVPRLSAVAVPKYFCPFYHHVFEPCLPGRIHDAAPAIWTQRPQRGHNASNDMGGLNACRCNLLAVFLSVLPFACLSLMLAGLRSR